ncbi:hypothetical protein [Microbacterium sp. LWH3-1.2]|uniref:hypothetical protein n=1 Tax=Microbacterium sp. LWH3-1.2 TaxID=3135256 RepID=UPI00343F6967
MRRISAFLLALLVVGAALVGCSPATSPAIFDRDRTAEDELPAGLTAEVNADTSRYVGEDSAGNRFWVVQTAELNGTCIILVDVDTDAPWSGCGGPPIALTIESGLRVELADYPDQLSESNAELIGDTLLVGSPR